jgi:hypothetical protein
VKRARILKTLGGVVLTAGAITGMVAATSTPSMDRDWAEDMRIMATGEVTAEGDVRLSDVRNWRYARDSVVSRGYLDGVWDPRDVRTIWLYSQEFDEGGWTAHTFLVFEFDESYGDRRYLGISMEARREVGEDYSIARGLMRGFEAAIVWATEEDLVSRRTVYAGVPIKRFRLVVRPEVRAAVFRGMVEETRALAARPRWYNTALYNCTNALVRYTNHTTPGAIPRHYSWVLTGRVDEYLERLGYLDPEATRTFEGGEPIREDPGVDATTVARSGGGR